jgi:hypothetical protein
MKHLVVAVVVSVLALVCANVCFAESARGPLLLDLQPRFFASVKPVRGASKEGASPSLSKEISEAAKVGLLDQGVEASREALLDCQKGDYPGGGLGLLSLPFGQVTEQSHHCHW